MELHYQLMEEDYIQFNLYHLANSPSQQKVFQISRFGFPLLLAGPVYWVGTRVFQQPSIYWAIIALLYTIGWMVFFPKLNQQTVQKQLLKMSREGDNSFLYGEKRLRIENDTLTIEGEESTEVFSKSAVKEIKVYEDIIVLYISAVSAHIIPTRNLTQESIRLFIEKLG